MRTAELSWSVRSSGAVQPVHDIGFLFSQKNCLVDSLVTLVIIIRPFGNGHAILLFVFPLHSGCFYVILFLKIYVLNAIFRNLFF